MNSDNLRVFRGCLVLVVGGLLCFILWVSAFINWDESDAVRSKVPEYLAIAVLLPLTLWIGFKLILKKSGDLQSLKLNQKDADPDHQD